jgi:uncharacterized OsmC-like protein
MYSVTVSKSPIIDVSNGKHAMSFAVDGSQMNPLEAFYASLAACAAVFAKKACKELGVSPDGIAIDCRPYAGTGGPLTLSKFKTEVRFPAEFTAEQKARVLDAIATCAVKEIVATGPSIEFTANEA